jgi:hypothetical protein
MAAVFLEFYSCDMAASTFLQVSWAVAAEFPRIIYYNIVSSVVSNDVISAISEEFNPASLSEFTSFLV